MLDANKKPMPLQYLLQVYIKTPKKMERSAITRITTLTHHSSRTPPQRGVGIPVLGGICSASCIGACVGVCVCERERNKRVCVEKAAAICTMHGNPTAVAIRVRSYVLRVVAMPRRLV